jgi:hypothetical protein
VVEPGVLVHLRRFLSLESATAASGLPEQEVRALLDRYVASSILQRGFLLSCARCNDTSFYRIEDVGQLFQCSRCHRENLLVGGAWRRDHAEPVWFYELDEVVLQALEHNASVPLLALNEVSKKARSFLYMFDSMVADPVHGRIEIDLWAIADGSIVLGEAKLQDEIEGNASQEQTRVRRLAAVARKYTADRFVLATAATTWKDRTVAAATTEFRACGIDVQLLTGIG